MSFVDEDIIFEFCGRKNVVKMGDLTKSDQPILNNANDYFTHKTW